MVAHWVCDSYTLCDVWEAERRLAGLLLRSDSSVLDEVSVDKEKQIILTPCTDVTLGFCLSIICQLGVKILWELWTHICCLQCILHIVTHREMDSHNGTTKIHCSVCLHRSKLSQQQKRSVNNNIVTNMALIETFIIISFIPPFPTHWNQVLNRLSY